MLEPNPRTLELQALLDAAVDAVILINARGGIEIFNGSAERLFGYAAAEVIGQNVSMLMGDHDRAQHDACMQRFQSTGIAHIIGIGREVSARRKDGLMFPAFLSVGRIAGADPARYVGFLQDLTLRQQALSEVVRERDRANAYLEAAQTMLVALDLKCGIALINRKGCEILGYSEAELLGRNWFDSIAAPEERAAATAQFTQFLADQSHRPYYTEFRVRVNGGALRLLACRYVVVTSPEHEITGVLCSGDDVTDVRLTEELARDARERMTRVSRLVTIGEMTAGIAHELNQPLAAITTYAQAAKRLLGASPPGLDDVSEALDQIASQGLRAGAIIRRLRSLVRNPEAQCHSTPINDVVEEFITLMRSNALTNAVRIGTDLTMNLPPVHLDRIQIQQVLMNLVGNAVHAVESKASEERAVMISTGLSPDGDVEVRVQDTGSGVSHDMVDKLFLPFATTKTDGAGLGLAVSRSIIEAHKGKLQYTPNSPQGACFIFRLPALKEADL